MSRCNLPTACLVVLTAILMPSARAQDESGSGAPPLLPPPLLDQPAPAMYGRPTAGVVPYQPISTTAMTSQQAIIPPTPLEANLPQSAGFVPQQHGYVRLNAPMYPTPRPNIPIWTGSTVITNQAFAPQEMLYPHTYRAVYPPFYHKVHGGWVVTPFGVRSHERWELQGTKVEVKYRANHPGLFSGAPWHPHLDTPAHGTWR